MEYDLGSAVGDLVKPQAAFTFSTIWGCGATRAQCRKINHKKRHWQPLDHTAAAPMHSVSVWDSAARFIYELIKSVYGSYEKDAEGARGKQGEGWLLLHASCVYVYSTVVTFVACEGCCEVDLMTGWASWVSKANPPSTSPSFLTSPLWVCLLCWRPVLPLLTDVANVRLWLTKSMQTRALHNYHLGKKDACVS